MTGDGKRLYPRWAECIPVYRLNAVRIKIDPLRKRKEDVVPTTYHFLQNNKRGPTGKGVRFRTNVKQAIENYEWPGNYHELRCFPESLPFKTDQSLIELDDLPNHIKTATTIIPRQEGRLLRDYLREAQKFAFPKALAETDENK